MAVIFTEGFNHGDYDSFRSNWDRQSNSEHLGSDGYFNLANGSSNSDKLSSFPVTSAIVNEYENDRKIGISLKIQVKRTSTGVVDGGVCFFGNDFSTAIPSTSLGVFVFFDTNKRFCLWGKVGKTYSTNTFDYALDDVYHLEILLDFSGGNVNGSLYVNGSLEIDNSSLSTGVLAEDEKPKYFYLATPWKVTTGGDVTNVFISNIVIYNNVDDGTMHTDNFPYGPMNVRYADVSEPELQSPFTKNTFIPLTSSYETYDFDDIPVVGKAIYSTKLNYYVKSADGVVPNPVDYQIVGSGFEDQIGTFDPIIPGAPYKNVKLTIDTLTEEEINSTQLKIRQRFTPES